MLFVGKFDRNEPGSAGLAAAVVADQFRDRFGRATGYQSIAVPVRRRPGHAPLFLLTLFFRHPAAGYHFVDAASLANRDWRHHNRRMDLEEELARLRDDDNSLFDVGDLVAQHWEQEADAAEQALEDAWVERIAANIRELVRQNRSVPVGARVADVYGDVLGMAREKHLRKAWDRAAAEGIVRPRARTVMWRQMIVRATQ